MLLTCSMPALMRDVLLYYKKFVHACIPLECLGVTEFHHLSRLPLSECRVLLRVQG